MSVQGTPAVKTQRQVALIHLPLELSYCLNSSPPSLITLASLFAAFGSDRRFGPDGGDILEPARAPGAYYARSSALGRYHDRGEGRQIHQTAGACQPSPPS